jgi:hypothetical protein
VWSTLSRRVDKIEQKLYTGGNPNMEEQLRFLSTFDAIQLRIFKDWCDRGISEGYAEFETLRQHLSAYDDNGTVFDYETGEYRQPNESEKGSSSEPKKKTVKADQVIKWLLEQHRRNTT